MCELEELVRKRNEARKKVVDWMKAQGARGNFVQSSQAPERPEYDAAETALEKAIAAVGPSVDSFI